MMNVFIGADWRCVEYLQSVIRHWESPSLVRCSAILGILPDVQCTNSYPEASHSQCFEVPAMCFTYIRWVHVLRLADTGTLPHEGMKSGVFCWI